MTITALHPLIETPKAFVFDPKKNRFVEPDGNGEGFPFEVLRSDLKVRFFVHRDGVERELTERQAVRRALDAAGRDPETGKPRDSSKWRSRRRVNLETILRDAMQETLSWSDNGTTRKADLSLARGLTPSADSDRVHVGYYRGSHKGYPVYGTEHEIQGSVDDFAEAILTLGRTVINHELIPMRIEHVATEKGMGPEDPRRVYKLTAVRQSRGGAEVVERFVVAHKNCYLDSDTMKGLRMRLKKALREEAARIAETEREKASRGGWLEDGPMREAVADLPPPADEDLDAIAMLG